MKGGRRARAELLARNPTCQMCGYAAATEAHHWCYPRGAVSARHLTALCSTCHRLATMARRFLRGRARPDRDEAGRRLLAAFAAALAEAEALKEGR